MGLRRGDIVSIALPGAYGKPRPALVVQSEYFSEHPSITVLPITSELRATPLFRVGIRPDAANGLRTESQIMVDKAHTVPREKIGEFIGHVDDTTMLTVSRSLSVFLGIVQ
jgi:mRNA interferase MazF